MKNLSIVSLVICSFAFILDIIDAIQAAFNHNIQSLVFSLFLSGIMLICLRMNCNLYRYYKHRDDELKK